MGSIEKISTFDFGGHKVRTAGTSEQPLFCAKDVCEVLGYERPDGAIRKLDPEEQELVLLKVGASTNRAVFVTESGLFSLILRSEKAEAKKFKRWVTSEVLPEIRKRGYYNAVEAQLRKQTELLLEQCFPNLPQKSAPIFRELIAHIIRLRRETGKSGNPPWARSLASMIYAWAVPLEGQQPKRREKNPHPNGSHVDHSMFGDKVSESVRHVVQTGCDFAKISGSYPAWKTSMELVFGKKAIQLPLMVSVLALPGRESIGAVH